jgi:hypothetical protein
MSGLSLIMSQHRVCLCVLSFIHSFIPLARAECDNSLPFWGASSIPLSYIPFCSTLFHQPVFHPPSLHLAVYFLVCLSALLFTNSYIQYFFGKFYILPFSVGYRSSTVVKVLRYESEGHWFDSRWCHGIFHWHNPSDHTMAVGSTQPLTEMSTRSIYWGVKAAGT